MTALVRPLGALERLFYRYSDRNPVHFMLVAEFDIVLDERAVRCALERVRRRHPLLQVHVEDREDISLVFCRAGDPAPIPLRVITSEGRRPAESWHATAAEELVEPFDRYTAPLIRAVLLADAERSALMLTIDHTIGDGISTVVVLRDVLAVLNGWTLPVLPVPPSQETMLDNTFGVKSGRPVLTSPNPDPRMQAPTSVHGFDGTPSAIQSVAVPAEDTAALRNRCRAERTTVHAAIVTAAARVRSRMRGEDFVRVLNPIDCRSQINGHDDVALYFSSVITAMTPLDGTPFWDQARTVTAALATARSATGILAASAGLQQLTVLDADAAEHLFTNVRPFEMLVSNLGVQNLDSTGPLRPTALWGPVQETQLAGCPCIGITTYGGILRMVAVSYQPVHDFLDAVAQTLAGESA